MALGIFHSLRRRRVEAAGSIVRVLLRLELRELQKCWIAKARLHLTSCGGGRFPAQLVGSFKVDSGTTLNNRSRGLHVNPLIPWLGRVRVDGPLGSL